MSFSVEVFQNEYLAEGATQVHAIVKATSTGGQGLAATADKVVVLVVDTSGSMQAPATKIRSARRSAAAAVELLPDGTLFAVVAGDREATCIYPTSGYGLARADQATRSEAAKVAARLEADGGTAISTWIDLVRELVEPYPTAIRLAYLLTDGRNESERPEALDAALGRATGVFQCDARGVGADWSVRELRRISSALLGDVGRIATPDEMEKDFRDFMDRAIGRTIADVRLRVWAPEGSKVDLLSQVAPTIEDLTTKADPVPPLSWNYPTGAWAGNESRDYHLCVDVPPGDVGDDKLAARISLVVGDAVVSQGLVKSIWTDDVDLSTRINRQVARYTHQEDLAQYVDEGLEALEDGDLDTATEKFERVMQLAEKAGREDVLKAMSNLVEIDGDTVQIKPDRAQDTINEVGDISFRTVRVEGEDSGSSQERDDS